MKTLFSALFLSALLWTSCQNKPAAGTSAAEIVEEGNQTRGGSKAQDAGQSVKKVLLARRWTNGEQFMDIKLEGTFAANLGKGEIAGTWELDEESGALTFNGEKAAEGKGHAEKASYTLKDLSDTKLQISDAAGTVLTFEAQ